MKSKEGRRIVTRVVASPLRRKAGDAPLPLVSRNLKQGGGLRKIIQRNHMMELEVSTLKRRIQASKEHQRRMKANMREQRDQTFQIISRVASVLEDKENQIQELHARRETELSTLSRELLILQANMLKEQTRLQGIITELNSKVSSQDSEIKDMKERLSYHTDPRREDWSPTSDLETLSPPSSEESSPKSLKTPPGVSSPPSKTPPLSTPSLGKPPLPSRVGVNRKISYRMKEMRMRDEGFVSGLEENGTFFPYPRNSPHPGAKRSMSLAGDPRIRSISKFGTLEELQVSAANNRAPSSKSATTTIIRYLDYL